MDEMNRLAEIVRRFADIETLASAIENYDTNETEIETIEELNVMLSDELDYSGW
jgi:hypothetical protein